MDGISPLVSFLTQVLMVSSPLGLLKSRTATWALRTPGAFVRKFPETLAPFGTYTALTDFSVTLSLVLAPRIFLLAACKSSLASSKDLMLSGTRLFIRLFSASLPS